MAAIPTPQSTGREFFTAPAQVNQRRYEALRAYYAEDLTLAAAGQRFGYTRATMASLVRDFRAGRLELFAPPGKPGRKSAPAADRARGRVIALRRQGLSVYESSTRDASPTSMTCSATPVPHCSPAWPPCPRRAPCPTTPTGSPITTSGGS